MVPLLVLEALVNRAVSWKEEDKSIMLSECYKLLQNILKRNFSNICVKVWLPIVCKKTGAPTYKGRIFIIYHIFLAGAVDYSNLLKLF